MDSRKLVLDTLAGAKGLPVPWIEIETRDELIAATLGVDTVDWPERVRYAKLVGQDAVGFAHWQRFGCKTTVKGQVMGFEALIDDWDDLPTKFSMPDEIDEEALIENVRRAHEAIGDSGLALFVAHVFCLDPAVMDLGFENFCYKLYDDPKLIEWLFEKYVDYYGKLDRLYSKLPEIDFIWIGEDIAFNSGTYVAPDVFREFVLPYFRKMAANIAKPWVYHSDGNILHVLDDLLTLGMSAVHPLQPGAMDIRAVKQSHGDKATLIGCVDLNTLTLGSEEDVENEVAALMDDCSSGGRYILSSSNSLACYLKPENVIAMGRAKRAWNKNHGFGFF
ncbi:MAG: uroporphyrinogen decarboxylase family protein [Bacillota bacterium]